MKTKTFIDDYIKLRELVLIQEGKFYCQDMKVSIKRCNEQCKACKEVVEEKIK